MSRYTFNFDLFFWQLSLTIFSVTHIKLDNVPAKIGLFFKDGVAGVVNDKVHQVFRKIHLSSNILERCELTPDCPFLSSV